MLIKIINKNNWKIIKKLPKSYNHQITNHFKNIVKNRDTGTSFSKQNASLQKWQLLRKRSLKISLHKRTNSSGQTSRYCSVYAVWRAPIIFWKVAGFPPSSNMIVRITWAEKNRAYTISRGWHTSIDNTTDKTKCARLTLTLTLTHVCVFLSYSVHRKQPEKNQIKLVYAGLDRMRQLSCN